MRKSLFAGIIWFCSLGGVTHAQGIHFDDAKVGSGALAFINERGLPIDPAFLPTRIGWGGGARYLACGERVVYRDVLPSDIPRVQVLCITIGPDAIFLLIRRGKEFSAAETMNFGVNILSGALAPPSQRSTFTLGGCTAAAPTPMMVSIQDCEAKGGWYTHHQLLATVIRGGVQYDFVMQSAGRFPPSVKTLRANFNGLIRGLAPQATSRK